MKEVKAYKCDYCRKVSLNRLSHHEKYCKRNPVNRHECIDCENLVVDREVIRHNWDEMVSIKTFYCKVKDKKMHTYIAARRNLEVVNRTELMPNKCDQYKPLDLI